MFNIIVVTLIAVAVRLIEDARKLRVDGPNGRKNTFSICALYDALNFHAALSLALLAYVLSENLGREPVLIVILLMICGVALKAISCHEPEELSLNDRDALIGLFLPNFMAVSAAIFVILTKTKPWTF